MRIVKPVNVTVDLRKLRERAGLSKDRLAKQLGMKGGSSYQRYEDATLFTKEYLPQELVEKLTKILVGLGDPPIDSLEVLRLGGYTRVVNKAFPEGLLVAGAQSSLVPRLIPLLQLGEIEMFTSGALKKKEIKHFVSAGLSISDNSVCLTLTDDSMCTMGEVSYNPGDAVVLDMDVPYRPGNLVVAKLDNENEAVFRRFGVEAYDDDGNPIIKLIPLNPFYPVKTIDAKHPGKIYGRVVEHRRSV